MIVRFFFTGRIYERANFKNKVFWGIGLKELVLDRSRDNREVVEDVGVVGIGWGGFDVGKMRFRCLNVCVLSNTRRSYLLNIGVGRWRRC